MWIHWGCKTSTCILIFYVVNNFDVSKKKENAICNLINYIYNVIVI